MDGAPRSRSAEAEGAIYLNAQHPDHLAAKSAQARGDPRPMLVYQMGCGRSDLLATDPYATAARQADDLAGLVSRSQKWQPNMRVSGSASRAFSGVAHAHFRE